MTIQIPKTPSQAFQVMENMLQNSFSTEEVVEFLQFFQHNPASTQILQAFLNAIKASAVYTINTDDFDKPIVDIAGTGGDGKHTINISTLTGLFCAATGLVKVAKYGNRAASGICGSMDVLEANGIPIELSSKSIKQDLRVKNFSPLFARSIYPGARSVAEARSQIDGPTIFNILFPLARPITGQPRFVFGIADKRQMNLISEMYVKEKGTRCILVHGLDGTDEISVSGTGETNYVLIDDGQAVRGQFNCQKLFGIEPVELSKLQVSSKEEAIKLFVEICNPLFDSPKITAIRQSVYANAAVALFIGLDSENMNINTAKKYLPILKETLSSGKIMSLLQNLQTRTKEQL